MGPNSIVDLRTRGLSAAQLRLLAGFLGLEAWLVALVALPAPLAARLLLGAPLVAVPTLLAVLPERRFGALSLTGWPGATWLALAAALPLLAAFALPPGPLATTLALPWILLCVALGLSALVHGLPRVPELLRPANSVELATDLGLGLLAVGGLFTLAERLGLTVLGFGPLTMLLGAIHYHFLGFGLVALTAWAAGRGGWPAYVAGLGVAGGMASAASGMATGISELNWLGVLVIGLAGLVVVGLLVGRARNLGRVGLLAALSAVLLGIGLSLGIGWSSSLFLGFAFIDFEAMVRVHGSLNASAVVLAALSSLAGGRAG